MKTLLRLLFAIILFGCPQHFWAQSASTISAGGATFQPSNSYAPVVGINPSGLPKAANVDSSGNLITTLTSGSVTLTGTAIALTPVATLTSGTYTYTNLKSLDLVAISGTTQLATATGTNSYIAGGTPSGYSRSFAPNYVATLSVIVSGTAQVNYTK